MRKKWIFLLLILVLGLIAALLLPWLPGAIRRPQLYGPEGWLARRYGPSQGGADDVRAILILDDGFLVATGAGVARYAVTDGRPSLKASYSVEDGLPSDNCYLLKMDSAGGVWAACEGGVAYLPKGGSKWQPFTDENGLPASTINDLVLSGRGDRVWVSTSGGLATATVESRQWKSYARKDLLDAFVHPDEDVVWVRRVIPFGCSCGCQMLTSEFDLKTEAWSDIPDSQKCPHVAPEPIHFCRKNRLLWLSGQLGPPLLYNPSTRKTRTWPSEPNWERITKDRVVTYSEWFGEVAPARDDSGRMWFATTGGLWRYDPDADKWEQHARTPDL